MHVALWVRREHLHFVKLNFYFGKEQRHRLDLNIPLKIKGELRHLSPQPKFQPTQPSDHQYFHQPHHHLHQLHLVKRVWRSNVKQNIYPVGRLLKSRRRVVSVAEYARSWSQEVWEMSAKATLPKCYQGTFPAQEHSYWVVFCKQFDTLMSVWRFVAFNQISVKEFSLWQHQQDLNWVLQL